jgi:hypothetical protein
LMQVFCSANNRFRIYYRWKQETFSNHDFYLVRTDANGDTLWTKTFCKTAMIMLIMLADNKY